MAKVVHGVDRMNDVTSLIAKYPALSIRQPYAWCCIHGGKDVENRVWKRVPKYRGPLLIHAGKRWHSDTLDDVREYYDVDFPGDLPRGGIVGIVDFIGVVSKHWSPWFTGPIGLVFRNPRPLPFTSCKGALGFFVAKP